MFEFEPDGAGGVLIGSGWLVVWLLIGLVVGAWRWHVQDEHEARELVAAVREGRASGGSMLPLWWLGAAMVVVWFVAEMSLMVLVWPGPVIGTAILAVRSRRQTRCRSTAGPGR